MTERATVWSVTINMKSVSQSTADECIQQARARGWQVEGQMEQGETGGTKHYQLLVRTPQVRFSALKKAFPTAHIEAARNVAALKEYVHKVDTRVGILPLQDDRYPSITKMWKLIWGYILDKDWYCEDLASINCAIESIIPTGDKQRLEYLDYQGAALIKQGYYVEQHIVNPQVRSSFSKFAAELCHRTLTTMNADRQTDRQTEFAADTIIIPTTDGTEDEQSEVDEEDQDQDQEQDSGSDAECSDEEGSEQDD